MKNPLLSVIIPTYNEEKDIIACLDSLKGQTYKNYEIIIVDDGSTDSTLDIVSRFKNIRILKQNHQGPGAARNYGAKEAKGEILIFVDADMHWHKDYLKNLIAPMIRNKSIIGTTHDYEEATNTDNKWSFLWGKMRVDKDSVRNVHVFRAIRKSEFLRYGGFDNRYGYADDQTLWFKHRLNPTIAENTICYHRNPSSLGGTFRQARWIGASWIEKWNFLRIPILKYVFPVAFFILIPPAALYKAANKKADISFQDRLKFYLYKFCGYAMGLSRSIYKGLNTK